MTSDEVSVQAEHLAHYLDMAAAYAVLIPQLKPVVAGMLAGATALHQLAQNKAECEVIALAVTEGGNLLQQFMDWLHRHNHTDAATALGALLPQAQTS